MQVDWGGRGGGGSLMKVGTDEGRVQNQAGQHFSKKPNARARKWTET